MLNYQTSIHLGAFIAILTVMAVWELFAPRRTLATRKISRWAANLTLAAIGTVAVYLLVPVTLVTTALLAQERGWGLLNHVVLAPWLAVALGVMALDFVIYLQHVLFHAVPAFWRFHMVHHTDLDLDVTTGVRFHPVEILLSMGIKLSAVLALGPPATAVLLFEILLNGTSMFNHANLRLHAKVDRVLRLFVVTPDMHRVHHSVSPRETNSNFGFNLPWWDRLFGTYRGQPAAGHEGMTLGLSQFRDPQRLTLPHLLGLPFVAATGEYPINQRGERRLPDGGAPLRENQVCPRKTASATPMSSASARCERQSHDMRISVGARNMKAVRWASLAGTWLVARLAFAGAVLQVSDAWVRATVPGQKVAAAYMNLEATTPLQLVRVDTSVAEVAQIHAMSMDGGVMRMRELKSVDLPKGQPVRFDPGGIHLMLVGLKRPLGEGQSVRLTLTLLDRAGKCSVLAVDAPVRQAAIR